MTSAVLDTNALVSGFVGFLNPRSTPGLLLQLCSLGDFELVTSEPILDELARTFDSPYFAARLTKQQRRENIQLLRNEASVVAITRTVRGVASHPEDDVILATATSARADALVTGDQQLLKLEIYEGVAILSPLAFLNLLETT